MRYPKSICAPNLYFKIKEIVVWNQQNVNFNYSNLIYFNIYKKIIFNIKKNILFFQKDKGENV